MVSNQNDRGKKKSEEKVEAEINVEEGGTKKEKQKQTGTTFGSLEIMTKI